MRGEICVVGDPAQTIYSFAGANADYLRDFPRKFAGTTSVELVRNYRSTPEIVQTASTLLAGTPSQGVALRSQQPAGSPVDFAPQPDEVAEAEATAARILELKKAGQPLGEIAVLFRINAQSEAFEEALTARKIPYVVRGAGRFFERPEVREAVTRIRGAARSAPGEDLVETVRSTLAGMGWTSVPPTARGQTRDRWESWQALVDQAEEFSAGEGTRHEDPLNAFVDDLDRRAAEQHAPVADGVTLATFHAAKGLEWDAVFCVGLQDGTLPITYAETPAQVEEERRLLYVGVTRARERLYLSRAVVRSAWGAPSHNPASRFLDEMPVDLVDWRRTEGAQTRWSRPDLSGSLGASGGGMGSPTASGRRNFSAAAARADAASKSRKRDRPVPSLTAGDRVTHDSFGLGTVVSVEGEADRAVASIDFGSDGVKRLLLRYAPVEKL